MFLSEKSNYVRCFPHESTYGFFPLQQSLNKILPFSYHPNTSQILFGQGCLQDFPLKEFIRPKHSLKMIAHGWVFAVLKKIISSKCKEMIKEERIRIFSTS